MTDNRLNRLRGRHAQLDAAINEELARPLPDFLRIRVLKRRKLMLKEAIMQRSLDPRSDRPLSPPSLGDLDTCPS